MGFFPRAEFVGFAGTSNGGMPAAANICLRFNKSSPLLVILTLGQSREAVCTPAFAAYSMMHEKEAVGIVLILHCE
jgi:hypothetical protein